MKGFFNGGISYATWTSRCADCLAGGCRFRLSTTREFLPPSGRACPGSHPAGLGRLPGELANLVRERKNGNRAYYNVNTHLNATNICVYRCNFCAFRADLKSPKGYVMSDAEIVERAVEAAGRGATELHIVGGLHHQLPYDWYLNVVRLVHESR